MKDVIGTPTIIGRGLSGMGNKVWMYAQECTDGSWLAAYTRRKDMIGVHHVIGYYPDHETASIAALEWGARGQTSIMTATGPMRIAAALMGSKGGSSTSDAKARAARENGRRGGRPKKSA